MEPLLRDMCRDEPEKRPTMDEVVRRFAEITRRLSGWKLRSRLRQVGDKSSVAECAGHWVRQVRWMVRGVPAIPVPRS